MKPDVPIILAPENRLFKLFYLLFYGVCALSGAFIFLSPFPCSTTLTNLCFYSVLGLGFLFLISRAIPVVVKTPLTLPFILFFAWAALSLLWALNFENTLNDVRGHLFYYVLFFWLLINFFNSPKRLLALGWILFGSAVVYSLVILIGHYMIFGQSVMESRLGGLLSDGRHIWAELSVNSIGALTIPSMLFGFFFYPRLNGLVKRLLLIACLLILLCATVFTQSRGTMTALGVAMVIWFAVKNYKILPLLAAGILLLFVFSPLQNRIDLLSFSERLKINYVFLQVAKDYPLKGVGFGIQTYQENLNLPRYIHSVDAALRPEGGVIGPHAWLLDILIRLGAVGLGLFAFLLFALGKMAWQVYRRPRDRHIRDFCLVLIAALVAYFIIGLAEPLFWFSSPNIIFYTLAAMTTLLWRQNFEIRSA